MKTTMQGWGRGAVLAGLVAAATCAGAAAQTTTRNPGNYPPQNPGAQRDAMDDPRIPSMNKSSQEKMAISRNEERQRKLVADTNQLLDLATRLKEDVDKTDKYTLSLDVVKRTAEIEKLAKSIRERMKD